MRLTFFSRLNNFILAMIVAIQNIMSFLPHKQLIQVLIQNTIAISDFDRFPNQKYFFLWKLYSYIYVVGAISWWKH